MCEKCGCFKDKANTKKDDYTQNQKETVEGSKTYNEEIMFGNFDNHMA